METNDVLIEEKVLNNALLFNAIRKNNPTEKKLKQVLKYLERGADLNAVDANNKHNTPLHVAASKGEFEVAELLLGKGANIALKNDDNNTALDIALLSRESSCKEVANILKKYYDQYSRQSVNNGSCDDSFGKIQRELQLEQATKTQCQNSNKQPTQQPNNLLSKEKKVKTQKPASNTQYHYQKRSGTSGFSGHLYETKLLSLVLLRALNCENMKKFLLATNVDGMGAFDDVVFRYETSVLQNPKLVFLQAKHRDDPTRDKVTVDDVLKPNGDFSLQKYLESYLQIIERIAPDSNDAMFKGTINTVDCDFIIYTSAIENFAKKKVIENFKGDRYLTIDNNKGMIFQFDCDDTDLELLMNTVTSSRAVSLAKVLSKFTLRDNNNYSNMMMDDLIKTFHVFLEQNVISLETVEQDSKYDSSYSVGKFRQSFLTSTDELLLLMKRTIFNKFAEPKKITSSNQEKEIEKTIASLSFKLPANFGNVSFCFQGSEAKKQRRLNYLITKIKKLLPREHNTDSKYTIVKVDDSMVGPGKELQDTDIEYYRLGGLVGNLLIIDDETRMLKFCLNEVNLSEDNLKLLTTLREEFNDISVFRLDINVRRFPKLSISNYEHDRLLVIEFLSKLKFYTNQAKESEVEKVVKREIDLFFTANQKHDKSFFQIKCDAIFLKVHDKIQKWWLQSARVPYLNETCQFYHKAQEDILNSPVLSILNFIFRENMKKIEVEFRSHAVTSLRINEFLEREERLMVIDSNEINFTSKKLINYFNNANMVGNTSFIGGDSEFNDSYFKVVKEEIKNANTQVLILVCQELAKSVQTREKISHIVEEFKRKTIIISSNQNVTKHLANIFTEKHVMVIDRENSFNDLTEKVRNMILEERNVIFQGEKVALSSLLDVESLQFIHPTLLRKVIMNEEIRIGKILTSPCYDDIAEFYISQSICRYITLEMNSDKYSDLFIPTGGGTNSDVNESREFSDVVLLTESEWNLKENYVSKGCNVHLFSFTNDCFIWKQSQGNLKTILKHVNRDCHCAYTIQPKTLKDIHEKLVIISAEPGMGKSTLLTHLAIQTKRMYPNLWISKINLLQHIDCFSKWKDESVEINLLEAMKFIYGAIGLSVEINVNILANIVGGISINNSNNVYFNSNDEKLPCEFTSFELNLFNHLYNRNQVVLLVDGFDEICPDYSNEVLQLLNILKSSNVQHLWVTTRSQNVLNQLEVGLGTFSYTLQPLTTMQQKHFLQQIWSKKYDLGDAFNARIKLCVDVVFWMMTILIRETDFTTYPLHLYMVAEFFKEYFRDYYDPFITNVSNSNIGHAIRCFNLFSLYEMFVEIKFFRIRFGEKKPFVCFKDPDMRKLVEKEHKSFLEGHKKIGAYIVLDKWIVKELLSEKDMIDISKLIEDVKSGEEKTGLIECIVDNDPKFVHFSFAEYFATGFLLDKLCTGEYGPFQERVFDECLRNRGVGLRRFITSSFRKTHNFAGRSRRSELQGRSEICENEQGPVIEIIHNALVEAKANYMFFRKIQNNEEIHDACSTTVEECNPNNRENYERKPCSESVYINEPIPVSIKANSWMLENWFSLGPLFYTVAVDSAIESSLFILIQHIITSIKDNIKILEQCEIVFGDVLVGAASNEGQYYDVMQKNRNSS